MSYGYNKNKSIIYMYVYEGLSHRQIAEETGYSQSMVRHILAKEGYKNFDRSKKKKKEKSTDNFRTLSKEEFIKKALNDSKILRELKEEYKDE